MPRPLKVLTYLHSFEPGGLERDVLRFNAAWQAAGMDAQIVLGRREGVLGADAPVLPYILLQKGRFSTARFETAWMIVNLPRVIRRLRPDILFCAGNSYTIVAVAMRLLLGRACPKIVFRVSNDVVRRDMALPMRMTHRWWLRIQAPAFSAIVAMAAPARADIAKEMAVPPTRVTVINNASLTMAEIDRLTAARDTMARSRSGRHFLGIGRLAAQKNFELLVEAFARIARADDRLTIVGEGGRRTSIQRHAKRLGVGTQVFLVGYQSPVDAWFADADAFVLSSDYEGLGIVVIEALAAGLPIVATDCGPNMAALVEGVGRLVPPRDVGALAMAMDMIVHDDLDRAQMRERAQAFTVEANTNKWLDLFATLA